MFKKFLCVAFVAVTISLAFVSNAKAETRLGEYDDVTINIDKNLEKKISDGKYVTKVGEFSVERTKVGSISMYVDTRPVDAKYSLTYVVISSRDRSGNAAQKIKVPFTGRFVSFDIDMNKELIYELSIESNRRIIKNAKKDIVKINIFAGGASISNDDRYSMFTSNAGNKDISEFTTLYYDSEETEYGPKRYCHVAVYSGDEYMYFIDSDFSKNIKGTMYEIKVKNRFDKTNTIMIFSLLPYEIERTFKNK